MRDAVHTTFKWEDLGELVHIPVTCKWKSYLMELVHITITCKWEGDLRDLVHIPITCKWEGDFRIPLTCKSRRGVYKRLNWHS